MGLWGVRTHRIFEYFKKEIELNKEYYKNLEKENESAPMQVETEQPKLEARKQEIEANNNTFSHLLENPIYLVYEFGHLFKIYPVPSCPYLYYINIVQDAAFIISDGVQYDLSYKEAILAIAIPKYEVHLKSKIDKEMGSASALEFALREKGNKYWRQMEYDLAIACYGKATQLMAVSDECWDDADFYLVVRKLDELGRHKHADKWRIWLDRNVFSSSSDDEIKDIKVLRKCDPVDKKTRLILDITEKDMKRLTGFSYDFDCPIEKLVKDGAHPYAYIRLNSFNQSIAKKDLELLSTMIKAYPGYSSRFSFDISKIEYSEYSPSYGYTKLICTPKTPTGKIAKYPLSLSFMSRMDIHNYQCLGTIKYLNDGTIATAEVHIWRRTSWEKPGTGRSYYFKSIDKMLKIQKMDSI